MADRIKAVGLHEHGGPEVLRVDEVTLAAPAPN